jgi:hypothetical protein
MQQDGVLSKFSTAFGSDRGLLNHTEPWLMFLASAVSSTVIRLFFHTILSTA